MLRPLAIGVGIREETSKVKQYHPQMLVRMIPASNAALAMKILPLVPFATD